MTSSTWPVKPKILTAGPFKKSEPIPAQEMGYSGGRDWTLTAFRRCTNKPGELWPWNEQALGSPAALCDSLFSAAASFQPSIGHHIPQAAQPGAGPHE